MATILYVDDEPAVGLLLEDALERVGHQTLGARNVPDALQVLARGDVDLIISDYRMPGLTGLELLALARRDGHDAPLIMLTGHPSIEHAVTAIKAGAVNYITKPVHPEQLHLAVDQALELVRLRRENDALRQEARAAGTGRRIIADSPTVRRLLEAVAAAAPTCAAVLLQGERGTGKELFARAIHDRGDRRDQPFVALDCGALPDTLIESALFGHETGAFAGAADRVAGAFERAHGGTLLLDEVSEIRLDLQARLLRVLREQALERVGGTCPVRVDVRIVATTSRDLAAEVAAGRFHEDLYHRLSVMPVVVPPLRERPEDIPVLAHGFAVRTAAALGKAFERIAPEAMEILQRHGWPGNVRELEHAVGRAVILAAEPVLGADCFEGQPFGAAAPAAPAGEPGGDGAAVQLTTLNVAAAEAVLIRRALEATGQNRTRAAELLGISVRTLRNKLNGEGGKARRDPSARPVA